MTESIYDKEAPSNGGKFVKLASGESVTLRFFGDPVCFEKAFPGKEPQTRFATLCLRPNKETKAMECAVYEFGWGIQKHLRELNKDEEWGNPTGYYLTIKRTGEGLETKYSLIPKGKREPSEVEKGLIAACDWDLMDIVNGKNDNAGAKENNSGQAAGDFDPFED